MTKQSQPKRWISLGVVFGGSTPQRERYPRLPALPQPHTAAAAISPEETEARLLMKEAGYTPYGPYPGARTMPWDCNCDICGQSRRPTIGEVENGLRCRHKGDNR